MNHADDRVVRPSLEQLIPDQSMRDQFEEQLGAVEAGSLLRCFRRSAGLTQQDVAERLHMSLAKVNQIESAGDRGVAPRLKRHFFSPLEMSQCAK
jgi:DNA-binding XRE family transcriptional regulator